MILSLLKRSPRVTGDPQEFQIPSLATQGASTHAARNLLQQGLEFRQGFDAESANSSVSEELNLWYRF